MFEKRDSWKSLYLIPIAGILLAGGLGFVACSALSSALTSNVVPVASLEGDPELHIDGAGNSSEADDGTDTAGDGSIDDESGIAVDADHAAIAGLDPALREALQAAAAQAATENVDMRVTSGWRSADLQAALLQDAVERYGSEEEALKWVDTPERSEHVSGNAVDIGGLEAALWMGQYGSAFGFCQTFSNENWHFELAADAAGACPTPYADSSERP